MYCTVYEISLMIVVTQYSIGKSDYGSVHVYRYFSTLFQFMFVSLLWYIYVWLVFYIGKLQPHANVHRVKN